MFLKIFINTIYLLIFLLLVSLGLFQFHKANEKRECFKKSYLFNKDNYLKKWTINMDFPYNLEKIVIKGKYLRKFLYLDNQYCHHNFGYRFFVPLLLLNGRVILVDNGWISYSNFTIEREKRQKFFSISNNFHNVIGYAYYPIKNYWLLGEILERRHGIFFVESLDLQWLSKFLKKRVYPFILLLDYKKKHNCFYEEKIDNVSFFLKNYIYAFQWFFLSMIFIIFYLKK
ncbi:SURF1 family cytochrome oxidase biogenesis protein [Candidatus Legionella polyplacis]|uniref:SURF1-like protein n=1 Tax=Candidatus Legionella polyplacis TaxID=2005262 RepID=A0ABZ2GZ38_9GAMM